MTVLVRFTVVDLNSTFNDDAKFDFRMIIHSVDIHMTNLDGKKNLRFEVTQTIFIHGYCIEHLLSITCNTLVS